METPADFDALRPQVRPLGDRAIMVRFGDRLTPAANAAAVRFAEFIADDLPSGVSECVSSLVSTILHLAPGAAAASDVERFLRLRLLEFDPSQLGHERQELKIAVRYGGDAGPDLPQVAENLGLGVDDFIKLHTAEPLRVLATGFAPGFVYLGFHASDLIVPRNRSLSDQMPAGSVLFAAGQTAISATPIRTGWPIIGHTDFSNLDWAQPEPTRLRAGDRILLKALNDAA